jgi:OOP family OmpA-OmpF porin
MTFKTIALAGATLSLFLAASHEARAADGWYASVEGGAVWVDEWEHLRTKLYKCYSVTTPAEAVFETGWAALGALGYAMRNWRVEIEGGYRSNELETYEKNGWSIEPVSGELTEISAMLNVIYDVPLSEAFSLSIGAGAGGDYADLSIDLPWQSIEYNDWRFAYQGIAGVNYALTHNLAMFVNYRYLYVDMEDFQATPKLSCGWRGRAEAHGQPRPEIRVCPAAGRAASRPAATAAAGCSGRARVPGVLRLQQVGADTAGA